MQRKLWLMPGLSFLMAKDVMLLNFPLRFYKVVVT